MLNLKLFEIGNFKHHLIDNLLLQTHEQIWNLYIRATTLVGIIGLLISLIFFRDQAGAVTVAYTTFIVVSLLIHKSSLQYKWKLVILAVMLYFLGTCTLLIDGQTGEPRLLYFLGLIVLVPTVGYKWIIPSLLVTTITFFMLAMWGDQLQSVIPFAEPVRAQLNRDGIFTNAIVYMAICISGLSLLVMMNENIKKSLYHQLLLTADLEEKSSQLEVALVQLQEINQIQADLLNAVSYEFFTPMSVIKMSSKRLVRKHKQGHLTVEQSQAYHGEVEENIGRLTELINIVINNKPETNDELNGLIEQIKGDIWMA